MANEFATQIFYNDRSEVSGVYYRLDYAVNSNVKYLTYNYQYSYNTDGTLDFYSVVTDEIGGKINYYRRYIIFARILKW